MAHPRIGDGTDNERNLTALGALLAHERGDEEQIQLYPEIFSQFYLEYGMVSTVGPLFTHFTPTLPHLQALQARFSHDRDPHLQAYLNSYLELFQTGEVGLPQNTDDIITAQAWRAHLPVYLETFLTDTRNALLHFGGQDQE